MQSYLLLNLGCCFVGPNVTLIQGVDQNAVRIQDALGIGSNEVTFILQSSNYQLFPNRFRQVERFRWLPNAEPPATRILCVALPGFPYQLD